MSDVDGKTAFHITCEMLAHTRDALLNGDFASFARVFFLPHQQITLEGIAILESEADVKVVFDQVRENYARMGVDDVVRPLVRAEFIESTRIESTAITYFYAKGKLLNEPYAVDSELIKVGSEWQIASANYKVPLSEKGFAQSLMARTFPSEQCDAEPGYRHA